MVPELYVLDTPDEINTLRAYLNGFDLVAYDSETTGLTRYDQVVGISVCAEDDKAYYVALAKWDYRTAASTERELIEFPGNREALIPLLQDLTTKSLLMWNGLFDCMMAESNFKVRLIDALHTDGMVLAHLLDENRRVGLKEMAKAMLGEDSVQEQSEMKASVIANGGAWGAKEKEMYKADYRVLGRYGAKDPWLTRVIIYQLIEELYEQGLDKFFYDHETMPLLRGPTYTLNSSGLTVDLSRLTALKRQLQAECAEAKAFILQEVAPHVKEKYPGTTKKNGFNIGAPQQLSYLLFGILGLEFATLTKAGKVACKDMGLKLPYTPKAKRDFIEICLQQAGGIQAPEATVNGRKVRAKKFKEPWAYIACDKATLKKLAPRYKWIERLLEYQRKMKLLSTYVEGIEERTRYGVIYPSFLQHGTTSGRYSSRNPNFQNLPRDDKRIKECIIARPGKTFVGADYSQLEPRVFAYISGDERLKAAFGGTDDFYSVIGMEVYGKTDCVPQKEGRPDAFGIKYKRLRDLSKVIALASTYGATAHQLAPTTGKSIEDTQEDIDAYFERFPDVAKMMTDSHEMAKRNGFVTNIFGRPRRIPEAKRINKIYGNKPHAELPYEARGLLNLAVNHRIQSTGASIVNRAAIRLHENLQQAGISAKIVCQVHDSLIAECEESDAEAVALLMQDAMENTTQLKGIALEAVPKIGRTFADV